MQPLLRCGDLLTVTPPGSRLLRAGEVVMFSTEKGQVLVHRIVRRINRPDGTRYLIQGDRLPQPDGEIPPERIYGRVAALERDGKQISLEGPVMRLLGRLAALRSGGSLAGSRSAHITMRLFKRLPIFYRYFN